MSEPKVCPMRKDFEMGPYLEAAKCLQGKCEWWSECFDKCSKAAEVDRLYEIQMLLENIGRTR